jgi:hypothetical protein
MDLESGRNAVRGTLLLVSAANGHWIDLSLGLGLVILVALLILQSAFTNWCPADLLLRPLGLRPKLRSQV